MGLHYVVAALAIYDEYSNDVLDMPEGTCFPRLLLRDYSGSIVNQKINTYLQYISMTIYYSILLSTGLLTGRRMHHYSLNPVYLLCQGPILFRRCPHKMVL